MFEKMDSCVVNNFDKVCRICMKHDKTFLSINSFKIIDMIIASASVQIWENDDLPNQICHDCFLQLQNTINFKQLCESSDNAFRQIIQQNKISFSKNQRDFENIKDVKFANFANDHSLIDIKEEIIPENSIHNNSTENEKIVSGHYENNLKINKKLKIRHKNERELNRKPTKSEEESDTCEDIKNKENVIETYTCERCNQEFKKVWSLGQHMHREHRAKALKCNKCNLKYYHPLHLMRHQESTHNQLNLTCNVCKKVFANVYILKDHKLKHSYQNLNCKLCDRSFKDKQTLKHHNLEIHPLIEKYVACHICGKSIIKYNLKKHILIHEDRDKIRCELCSKTFVLQASLNNHIKQIHENHKPARNHLCNICGHATRSPAELRAHFLTHTNKRPYACDHCNKTYRRANHLKHHISHVHLNVRKFQCTFCPQAFYERRILVHHERRHTCEKPHKCEVCGKALKIHTNVHTNYGSNLSKS